MTDFSEFAGNASDNDLLWKAAIDDQTGEFFDKFNKNLARTDTATASKTTAMGGNFQKLALVAGAVGGVFGTVATAILKAVTGGVSSLSTLAKQSMELQTTIDSLNNSIEITGKNAGYSAEQLAKYEDAMKAQGLTTKDSLISIKKMISDEIDLTRATELLTIAQDASIVAGTKVSDTYLQLIQVIAAQTEASASQSNKQSAQMLKSLGLYVDFQAAYQRAALQSGRTVEQLTSAERQQIALNAAIQAGTQITGAYEDSQDSLSRIVRALPSYYEEIKLSLGSAFAPVYTMAMGEWETFLKNLVKWLQDNEDELKEWGTELSDFVSGSGKIFLQLLLDLVKVIPALTSAIPDLAEEIANTLGPALGVSIEQMDAAGDELQTLLKLIIMYSSGVEAAKKLATEKYGSILGEEGTFLGDLTNLGKQPALQLAELVGIMDDVMSGVVTPETETYFETFNEKFRELMESYDMYEDVSDEAANSTDTVTSAMEAQAIAAQKLDDALTSANYDLTQFKKKLDEEAATRAVKAQREEIIAAIQLARKHEDIERNNSERIKTILENAADSKLDLTNDLAEAQYEVERDHQKRLQELLEQFNYDANELARKRDAVGLLALIRRNKKELKDEETAVSERRVTAEENYKKTLAKMDENLKKQLEKAEEARQSDYESLERSLAREAELKALYDQWEEEDRQKSIDKTLQTMWDGFKTMDGMTKNGLNQLLSDWGAYFNGLATLVTNGYNLVASIGKTKVTSVAGSTSIPNIPAGTSIYGTSTYDPKTRNIGQAGQVSSLLINSLNAYNLKRIPSVAPSAQNKSPNDMHITVDGEGLDPYIQRVVANTLLEVERNRG